MDTKAKTIIERFGFKDGDLTTPEHDSLFIRLLDKKICQKMLEDLQIITIPPKYLIYHNCGATCTNCDFEKETFSCKIIKEKGIICLPFESAELLRRQVLKNYTTELTWIDIEAEFAIMSYQYNVGFTDLKITLKKEKTAVRTGVKGTDFYIEATVDFPSPEIYVEIKPKIKSIGELIRQISFYRSHISNKSAVWIVVTNDDSVASILQTQNILTYSLVNKELS
jgi:hypothetical protein